eukprot:CAMPEP_0204170332 /NCGR_PEP_ID=MMETSP0361-20130328/42302_1 /ASSEMBLY_ACC=CAM_ASM_000343 /TAXON_ID=268821 /ORGANISM="Scrippsiella Hangoei, Strain SHTV-5" /LENGTH=104 /DNA_ID=CAMNT_0051128043 /DNA_START=47 /DNA_END=358 /DNA_ORIENTATION=+
MDTWALSSSSASGREGTQGRQVPLPARLVDQAAMPGQVPMVRLSAWAPTVGTTARHSERPLLPPSAHLLPVVESGRGRGCGRGSGRGRGSAEPGGAAPSASAVA